MIEDKLSRDERIRLEALAQAVIYTQSNLVKTPIFVRDVAKDFEKFIRGEPSDAETNPPEVKI